MKLYCIYDSAAEEFSAPYSCKNDDVAKRMFKNMFATNKVIDPEDYSLYCVGSFNNETGKITCEEFHKIENFVETIDKDDPQLDLIPEAK